MNKFLVLKPVVTVISGLLVFAFAMNIVSADPYEFRNLIDPLQNEIVVNIDDDDPDGFVFASSDDLFQITNSEPGRTHYATLIVNSNSVHDLDFDMSITDRKNRAGASEFDEELMKIAQLTVTSSDSAEGTNGLVYGNADGTGKPIVTADEAADYNPAWSRVLRQGESLRYEFELYFPGDELDNDFQGTELGFNVIMHAEYEPEETPTPPTPTPTPTPTPDDGGGGGGGGGGGFPGNNTIVDPETPVVDIPVVNPPLTAPSVAPTETPGLTDPVQTEDPAVVVIESEPVPEGPVELTPEGEVKQIPKTGLIEAHTYISLIVLFAAAFGFIFLARKKQRR
ncbi:MAG: hypothetical protein LBU77_05490 [Clostridiales bacterium]|jgi:hypothetical protein|nr:hypothetical protein [Clostridiales bacterium]